MCDTAPAGLLQAREDAAAAREAEARFEAKLARGGQVEAARQEVLAQLRRVRRELGRQEALIRVGCKRCRGTRKGVAGAGAVPRLRCRRALEGLRVVRQLGNAGQHGRA